MNVIVIGGGPAGMQAAITAAENGNQVTLIEKMDSLGRKLLITGKGRCNITSSLEMEEFIKNTPGNGVFLYSAYKMYTNEDIIQFLNKNGLKTKQERGNRVFPVTDKSLDVLNCFRQRLRQLKVEVIYKTEVKEIQIMQIGDCYQIKSVITNKGEITADKIILATGGKSYPLTGSTGDGYRIAGNLGHKITDIKPSLVPLEIAEKELCKKLQGLSLKNTEINVIDKETNKIIYNDFGEMIFTHFGVSGPIILSGSAHLVRYKNIEQKMNGGKIAIILDFKPKLDYKKLDARILRDFEENKNKVFKNSLDGLLPQKLIPVIIERSGIPENKKVNEITKKERSILLDLLKKFEVIVSKPRTIDEAIITCGGIDIKQINPKTMESKIIKNLYFAGEIIDVDSYTGGFNLQIAYSTGYVAGLLQ